MVLADLVSGKGPLARQLSFHCNFKRQKGQGNFLCEASSFLFFFKFIDWFFRERKRETSICCSTYLCIHWLILTCALTGDQTHNLGVSGCSNWATWPVCEDSFIRSLALLSWSNCLPKVPPPNTLLRELGFNMWILGGHKHSDHSRRYGNLNKVLSSPSAHISLQQQCLASVGSHPMLPGAHLDSGCMVAMMSRAMDYIGFRKPQLWAALRY